MTAGRTSAEHGPRVQQDTVTRPRQTLHPEINEVVPAWLVPDDPTQERPDLAGRASVFECR